MGEADEDERKGDGEDDIARGNKLEAAHNRPSSPALLSHEEAKGEERCGPARGLESQSLSMVAVSRESGRLPTTGYPVNYSVAS